MNAAGQTTVEISGDEGAVMVRGRKLKAADYVLAADYDLPALDSVARFIRKNGHLPGLPAGRVVESEGVDLASFAMQLLAKIEELTLYAMKQDERIASLEARASRRK